MGFLFGLFAVVAIAAIAYSVISTSQRREAAAKVATRLGLTYDPSDHLGLTRSPHPIFRMGDRRRASNLVSGVFRDRPIVLFDYEYMEDRTDAKGTRSTST